MNATVGGTIGGIQSGDAVTKIEIVWKSGAETEAQAQAAVPPRAVTLTAAGDITAFQSGTYALSSANLVSGQTYTPAVRVTESRGGIDGFVGEWSSGTVFTAGGFARASTGKILFDDGSNASLWTLSSGTYNGMSSAAGELQIVTDGAGAGGMYYRTFTPNTGIYVSVKATMKTADMEARFGIGNAAWGEKYCTDNYIANSPQTNNLYKSYGGSDAVVYDSGVKEFINTPYTEILSVASGVLKWFKTGVQKYSGAQAEITSFDRVFILGGGGADKTATFDNISVCKSPIITCTGIPSGQKLRVNGSGGPVATSTGGTTSVDCNGLIFPVSTVELLDSSNGVLKTFTATNDIWGGDAFTLV